MDTGWYKVNMRYYIDIYLYIYYVYMIYIYIYYVYIYDMIWGLWQEVIWSNARFLWSIVNGRADDSVSEGIHWIWLSQWTCSILFIHRNFENYFYLFKHILARFSLCIQTCFGEVDHQELQKRGAISVILGEEGFWKVMESWQKVSKGSVEIMQR